METVDSPEYQARRDYMVRTQIEARVVKDRLVLEAMRRVPRHLFVPDNLRAQAYEDTPLGIGHGQTISQPFIVALMTEMLHPEPTHRVLEIGAGSGYQAAVLAEMVDTVYAIEIVSELGEKAEAMVKGLGYKNVIIRVSDGYYGWPEAAPFNGIIVAAAPGKVPGPLLDQLKEGGRLIIPVGDAYQFLEIYTRDKGRIIKEKNIAVRFVPMTGEAKKDRE